MDFSFSSEDCLNLEESLRIEWLETNGLGGYASSTILDCHTRKYHGLLNIPFPELNEKFVFLSKVEASIHIGDKKFHLSTNKYPGVFHPTGHKYIKEFRCNTHPEVFYHIGDIELSRSLMMIEGQNTVLLRYKLAKAQKPITLHLAPMLANRNIHTLTRENMYLRTKTYVRNGYYKLHPYKGMPPLFLDTSLTTTFHSGPFWMHNVEYLKERTRGFDYQEDLFCPGIIELEMRRGDTLYLRASLSPPEIPSKNLWQKEMRRRNSERAKFKDSPAPIQALKARSKQFIISNNKNHTSVTAGYHWFGEWGRDAMIALPGLTLECGRNKSGLEILKTYASYEKNGLIPNFLAIDGDNHAYNSIDASLWFFWAVQEYLKATGDLRGIQTHLLPTMSNIIKAFSEGFVTHVSLQDDGLIWVGNEDTQLTWMDAKVGGKPITPRYGLVVELNALWFNALSFYSELCQSLKIAFDDKLETVLKTLKAGFLKTFWNDDMKCLADVVNDKEEGLSIRPNQIFAVSLPYSPLNLTQKRHVIACIEKHLLTPYGLRTLSPEHPDYCAEYRGSPEIRDAAYHQGTVWPWLIGHFVMGSLSASRNKAATKKRLRKKIAPLFADHLKVYCIGGISEIFNASPPHTPKGCIHQAWSVGEVIRTWNILNQE
jgi:predicted glycogen debranching enzyme